MKKIKIVSLVLAIAMIFSNFSFVFAVRYPKEAIETVQLEDMDEEIRVIIELERKPLLDCLQAQEIGAKEYLSTQVAKDAREEIINTQKSIQDEIINTINSNATFKYSYTNTLNGFAAVVQKKDIAKIKALPGVKSVYIDVVYEIPEDDLDPRLQTSTDMIGSPDIWNIEGYKGEGTVVAVIDTGVDVNHEYMVISNDTDVKLTEESVKSILENYDLNAEGLVDYELTSGDVYYNKKFPYCFDYVDQDSDAYADANDHGVHCSGIVAANGEVASETNDDLHTSIVFNGVAPEAQIIGMKVFSSSGGGAPTSCTLAAVEDAVMLGVDAMNLSLGSTAGFTFYEGLDLAQYEYEYSFELARNSGIIVAVAAGNEDRTGILSYLYNITGGAYAFPSTSYVDNGLVGSPGTKYHATTVASVENMSIVLPYIKHVDGYEFYYNDNTDFVNVLDNQTLEYVYCGIGDTDGFTDKDVTGKIALIERGSLTFTEKVLNAEAAGAVGVIIFNNAANGDNAVSMALSGISIPAISIGRTFGLYLLNSADKRIIIDSSCSEGLFNNPTMGLMSDFTSWGCTPDLKLKPEITAPGGNIYSTIADNQYESMSGTSMATPHIAGAAAILQQYVNSDEKFAEFTSEEKADIIEALLMSTADVLYDEYACQYSPRRQGSGLANLVKAVSTDVYLMNEETGKAKVELGDNITNTFSIEFDAYNLSDEDFDYELIGSVFTEYPQNIRLRTSSGSYKEMGYYTLPYNCDMTYSEMFADGHTINPAYALTPSGITGSAIVTVPAGDKVHITIDVELSQDETDTFSKIFDNGFFVEGFIELLSLDSSQPDLSIPYMGFYGDWTDAPILDGSYYFDSYNDSDGSRNYFYGNSYPYAFDFDENGEMTGYVYALGSNLYNSMFAYPLIAFSPNGDNYCDQMGYKANLLRNAKELQVYIVNNNGELVKTIVDDIYWRKTFADYSGGYYLTSEWLDTWDGTNENGQLVPDGQYFYVISTTLDYEGAEPQNTYIPVKVDTTLPLISNIVVDKENMTLTVETTDNTYISYAAVYDTESDESMFEALVTPSSNSVFTFDISSFVGDRIRFTVGDVAGNEYEKVVVVKELSAGNPDTVTRPTPTPTPTTPEETDEITVPTNSIDITQTDDKVDVEVDKSVANLIEDSNAETLIISVDGIEGGNDIELVVPEEVIEQLLNNGMNIEFEYSDEIIFTVEITEAGVLNIRFARTDAMEVSDDYTTTNLNFDINVSLDGTSVSGNDKAVKAELRVSGLDDIGRAGIYTVDENGNLEYVMTYLNGDVLTFYPPHFSQYSVMVYNKTFDDVQGHWAQKYIEDMASKHVVNGKTETEFAPEDTITRAEFVTMVVRALGLAGEGKSTFANITSDKWYANYMSLAKDAGLIEGTTYNADGIISRAEMAKVIARAHGILNGNAVEFDGTITFTDVELDSEYAEYIGYAVENGLINGFPGDLFMPVENTTRAQAMTVIHKLLNK